MTLTEAKADLGDRYVLSPNYRAAEHPHHSAYARVDLRATFERVRERMRPSFSDAVSEVRQKLRLVYGKVA
jgi:hypothetical protein